MNSGYRSFLQLLGTISFVCLIGACDTREDYFYEHAETPTISLISENDSTIDGKRYVCVSMSWGDTIEIDYKFDDPYGNIHGYRTDVKAITKMRSDYYYWRDLAILYYNEEGMVSTVQTSGDEYDYTKFANHLTLEIDTLRNKLLIIESTTSAQEYYHYNGRSSVYSVKPDSLCIEAIITLSAANALGRYSSANIILKLYVNRPPVVDFDVIEVSGYPLHREIQAHCIDLDDDPIIAYEYCIDGKLVNNKSGYVSRRESVYGAGEAAYNGTYITSTKHSSVKHAFQETGTHIIYVRCQDSWGNWSQWKSQTISIN